MKIELTQDETEVLRDLLKSDLVDLKEEIYHTDDHDLKVELHSRQKLIEGIVGKLTVAAPAAA